MTTRGKLFIISGPSGSGKTSLIDDVLGKSSDFVRSVSFTTRPIRKGETGGCHYHFVTKEEFDELIEKDMLLEWAQYAGYFYGTPKKFVEEKLRQGKNVILVIEVKGAMQVVKKVKDAYLVFITTSSYKELEERIKKRGTDSPGERKKRLETAKKELDYMKYYDCIIINSNYNEALQNLKRVLNAKRKGRQESEGRVC
jgi:guanylate kinase